MFFLPILFGIAAVVLGVIGATLGDKPLGWYAAVAGAVGGIVGMILGALVYNATT